MALVTFPVYLFSEDWSAIRVLMIVEYKDINHLFEYWIHKVGLSKADIHRVEHFGFETVLH